MEGTHWLLIALAAVAVIGVVYLTVKLAPKLFPPQAPKPLPCAPGTAICLDDCYEPLQAQCLESGLCAIERVCNTGRRSSSDDGDLCCDHGRTCDNNAKGTPACKNCEKDLCQDGSCCLINQECNPSGGCCHRSEICGDKCCSVCCGEQCCANGESCQTSGAGEFKCVVKCGDEECKENERCVEHTIDIGTTKVITSSSCQSVGCVWETPLQIMPGDITAPAGTFAACKEGDEIWVSDATLDPSKATRKLVAGSCDMPGAACPAGQAYGKCSPQDCTRLLSQSGVDKIHMDDRGFCTGDFSCNKLPVTGCPWGVGSRRCCIDDNIKFTGQVCPDSDKGLCTFDKALGRNKCVADHTTNTVTIHYDAPNTSAGACNWGSGSGPQSGGQAGGIMCHSEDICGVGIYTVNDVATGDIKFVGCLKRYYPQSAIIQDVEINEGQVLHAVWAEYGCYCGSEIQAADGSKHNLDYNHNSCTETASVDYSETEGDNIKVDLYIENPKWDWSKACGVPPRGGDLPSGDHNFSDCCRYMTYMRIRKVVNDNGTKTETIYPWNNTKSDPDIATPPPPLFECKNCGRSGC